MPAAMAREGKLNSELATLAPPGRSSHRNYSSKGSPVPTRIILVDDHPTLIRGLASLFAPRGSS